MLEHIQRFQKVVQRFEEDVRDANSKQNEQNLHVKTIQCELDHSKAEIASFKVRLHNLMEENKEFRRVLQESNKPQANKVRTIYFFSDFQSL